MKRVLITFPILLFFAGCLNLPSQYIGEPNEKWTVQDSSELDWNCFKCKIGNQDAVIRISQHWRTYVITIFYPNIPGMIPVGATLHSPSHVEYTGTPIQFTGVEVKDTFESVSGEKAAGTKIWKSGKSVTVEENNKEVMDEWRVKWNKWFGKNNPPVYCFSFELPEPPLYEPSKLIRHWLLVLHYTDDPNLIMNVDYLGFIGLIQEFEIIERLEQ